MTSPRRSRRATPPTKYPVVELLLDRVVADVRHAPWMARRWAALEDDKADSEIRALCEHIRENGMVNPIIVHEITSAALYGDWEVEVGNQRLIIARHLGWKTIKAIVVPVGSDIATVKEHNYAHVARIPLSKREDHA